MHIGRCFSPTRRTRLTAEPAVGRERGVVRVVRRERAARRVDGVGVVDVDEPDRVPPAAVDVDAAHSPQWPRLYGIGSAASCPAVEDGATATPKNSPGDVAIVPSSAAA